MTYLASQLKKKKKNFLCLFPYSIPQVSEKKKIYQHLLLKDFPVKVYFEKQEAYRKFSRIRQSTPICNISDLPVVHIFPHVLSSSQIIDNPF